MARKPMVTAVEASPFGEVKEELVRDDRTDAFELPGYSDVRREQELTLRKEGKAEALPFRVHLTRIQKETGVPDYRKMSERIRTGYKLVSPDELEKLTGRKLWDENGHPTTSYQKGPDGTVRLNEYAVTVCNAEQAAANLEVVKRRQTTFEEQGFQRTALSGSEGKEMHFALEESN